MSLPTEIRLTALIPLIAAVVLGCGGARPGDEPTTAREKQRRDAKHDNQDTVERSPDDKQAGSKHWGGWRYKGERNQCFFSFDGKCFKTEEAACSAAKCGKKKCGSTGGGPALVACN